MSDDIVFDVRQCLAISLAADAPISRVAEEVIKALGIPAATLAALRAKTHVVVPRPDDWDLSRGRAPFRAVTLHYSNDDAVGQAANAMCDALAAAPEPGA